MYNYTSAIYNYFSLTLNAFGTCLIVKDILLYGVVKAADLRRHSGHAAYQICVSLNPTCHGLHA